MFEINQRDDLKKLVASFNHVSVDSNLIYLKDFPL